MKIARKYCRIYDLLQDEPSRNLFYKVFSYAGFSDDRRDDHLASIEHVILHDATEGCAIPNFDYLRTELDRLDETYLIDNGLSYRDVTRVDTFPSRKGKAITLILRHITTEVDQIVQVVAIEDTEHGPQTITPWSVPGRLW